MKITVLRLGHRPERDKRITTHVALVARAFGADSITVSTKDEILEETVRKVVKRFGGPFGITTGIPWRKALESFQGQIVHLTMYGDELGNALSKIDEDKDVLIVVGSTKVPRAVYDRADFNIGIGNQPHSEVAALAIFLDRLTQGKGLNKEFADYEMKIIPDPQAKIVIPSDWVPDKEECMGLLEEAGVPDNVVDHIMAVTGLALAIGKRILELGIEMDEEVLLAGSLLHDIGRAHTHDIFHAVEGETILDGYGIDPRVMGMIRNHIGAGLDPSEAQELGLPPGDYTPTSLEEKVLACADNLFDGDKRIPLKDELVHLEGDLGLPQVAKKVEELHEEMSKMCQMDIDDIQY
jgi:tRNA (cytidine56-2'-O)-methyltransferase